MLEGLLSNGGSSLYMPAPPAHLEFQLERIITALEGRDVFDRFARNDSADQDDVR